jgi:apolipoprotein N-acyltransferase
VTETVPGAVVGDRPSPAPDVAAVDVDTGRHAPARVRWRDQGTTAAGCLAAGALLCLALPPWGWWPLAFGGLVLLDRLIADQPARSRFARTWLAGLALYLPSLVWMEALTLPGYLIASTAYAAMLGVGAALAPPGRARWLVLPGTWTVVELVRWSWPFGGVPLSSLAVGQVAGPLAPVLRVGGAALLTVVTLAAAMALAAAVARRPRWAAGLATGTVALVAIAAVAPAGRDVGSAEVALVQGGGPQGTRKTSTSVIEVYERHLAATDGVRPPVDLVLWPEDVVDTRGSLIEDPWGDELSELARSLDAPLIVGAVEGESTEHFRNAAVLIDADGTHLERYDKVRRVPFGEYVPLRGLLEPIAGDSLPRRDLATSSDRGRLDVPGPVGRAAVPISWEVFFGDRAREGVVDGAGIILNPTNGASFSGTIVQTQQVASSRMRAIENGRWVLQVAPTGFSAVVAPDGTVVERSAVSERRVIQREVGVREGTTIYTRWGNAPALALAALGITLGWWLHRRRVIDA